MASFGDLRRIALELPGAHEGMHMGGPAFRVGNRKFALWWERGERTILKLDPSHQILLFETRPETFEPCRVGTRNWSFVALGNLDNEELETLVVEAWGSIVPVSVRRNYRASVDTHELVESAG